eukprot:s3639_g5.t1
MCRCCHALLLLRRLARSMPACLLPLLTLCLHCLLFPLPLLLPLRTLLSRPILCLVLCLSLRGNPEGARALFGPGLMTVPASFRPPRPDSCRPALARDGHAPMPLATAPVAAPHGPVATLYASDHVGAAPATACGKEHNDADPFGADDILAIAQGVANTQADLEILRNGVTDITESREEGAERLVGRSGRLGRRDHRRDCRWEGDPGAGPVELDKEDDGTEGDSEGELRAPVEQHRPRQLLKKARITKFLIVEQIPAGCPRALGRQGGCLPVRRHL